MPVRGIKKFRGAARGFTIMELLVVLGIFSTVVVAASDIFLLANASQRKVVALERTQADARFTIEAIVREVRGGVLDYAYYAGRPQPLALPDEELAVIDSAGDRIVFSRSNADTEGFCPDAASRPCMLVKVAAADPAPITPTGVKVQNAKFYVGPTADPNVFMPATGLFASDDQPRVTIVLVLKAVETKLTENTVVYLQSTVSSRSYRR